MKIERILHLLCMLEYGAAFIQQIVHAEFDAAFDNPAKGTIVMISDIRHEEGVIKTRR